MSRLAAGHRVLGSANEFLDLRAEDWDVLVARGHQESLQFVPLHWLVCAFASYDTGPIEPPPGWIHESQAGATYGGRQPSPTMHVHDDANTSERLRRLITTELVPELQAAEQRTHLVVGSNRYPARAMTHDDAVGAGGDCFVEDADRNVIAALLRRPDSTVSILMVPLVPVRPDLWLEAAFDTWEVEHPDRFTDRPTWESEDRWLTEPERLAARGLVDLAEEEQAAAIEFERRRQDLSVARLAASAQAAAGRRRLLTGDGPALVDEVIQALRQLGFVVENSDSLVPDGTPKMQDLSVTDPNDSGWTNITEVKGYGRGGKTGDLQRIARYARTYELRTGAPPATRWYVVNQFKNDSASTRPLLMRGADDDLQAFAEDGGLAIDTRDLFRLANAVEAGTVTAEVVRQALRTANGRFEVETVLSGEQP